MKNFVIVEDDALKLGRFLKEARSQKKIREFQENKGLNFGKTAQRANRHKCREYLSAWK